MLDDSRNLLVVDKPGMLGIVEGRLQMQEPQGKGAWPVILPSDGVSIFYKKQRVTRPTVVERVSDVSISVDMKQPKSEYAIVVSPDKMEVSLQTSFTWGMEYQICDSQFVHKLRLKTKLLRAIPPQAIDVEIVLGELEQYKVRGDIRHHEIVKACQELKNADVVILQGVPAKPPIDGRIEMVCESCPQIFTDLDRDRIDHRNRRVIPSVDVGDVLAYWHPPQLGIPGKNVYGEIVEPPAPRSSTFRAGRGVRLINEGRIAVAERPGRPFLKKNTLSVEPRMTIQQDVDMSVGNIRFKGDVIVLGNVCESMKIEAGGMVDVRGSVYHADIISGSHVTINRKLIGGHVSAGAQHPGLAKSLALLRQVIPDIHKLISACRQLRTHPKLASRDLHHNSDGHLIKLVLEMHFAPVPKVFEKVMRLLTTGNWEEQFDNFNAIVADFQSVSKHFMGSGPLEIQSLEQLEKDCSQLQGLVVRLEEYFDNPANITVNYCQNAKLEATGDISVTGSLIYDCDLVSENKIHIAGECRSGSCTAKSSIYAGSVGSRGMGITHLVVPEDGSISAQTFHPGVRIQIGASQKITTNVYHNKTFCAADGTVFTMAIQ